MMLSGQRRSLSRGRCLSINDNLVIDGGGDITVDGDDTYRVFEANNTLELDNLTVSGGSGGSEGGGVRVNASGDLTVSRSTFAGNSADSGGGVYNLGIVHIVGSTFSANGSATIDGGGVYAVSGSQTTITSSTFYGNSASGQGGGVLVGGTVWIYDSTFSGNSASAGKGAAVQIDSGFMYEYNTIMANSTSGKDCDNVAGSSNTGNDIIESATNCAFDGVAGNIVGVDPRLGPQNGSPVYFLLDSISPAIDAGSNDDVPGGVTLDQGGYTRFTDVPWRYDTGSGAAPIVDIGAAEYQWNCIPYAHIYVDANASGDFTGSSWANAVSDLQFGLALAAACPGKEVWVADGTYKPDGASPDDRALSFNVLPGLQVYGGFAGGETDLGDRDPVRKYRPSKRRYRHRPHPFR